MEAVALNLAQLGITRKLWITTWSGLQETRVLSSPGVCRAWRPLSLPCSSKQAPAVQFQVQYFTISRVPAPSTASPKGMAQTWAWMPALPSWASYLSPLNLFFSLVKMGIIISCRRMEIDKLSQLPVQYLSYNEYSKNVSFFHKMESKYTSSLLTVECSPSVGFFYSVLNHRIE